MKTKLTLNCKKCGILFDQTTTESLILRNKHRKFCSRTCSNSRNRSEEFKVKLSEKMKGYRVGGKQSDPKFKEIKVCPCGNQFECYKRSKQKYCTKSCGTKYGLKPTGGYRPGSGRAKSGYYKGIYCGSTYELAWVIWALDVEINFVRFQGALESPDGLKYIPDFYIPSTNTIVELKGYEHSKTVDAKTKLAESFGYNVLVLRKNNLVKIFEYVTKKHNTKNYETLYDHYKPKFEYTCNNIKCKKTFYRDKKAKTETVFCSNSCAGKYRAKLKHMPRSSTS